VTRSSDVASLLPLKPVELELLLALVEDERHGYALVQQIAERTDGVVQLEPGNLYRIIKRMLADGLVQEASRKAIAADSDERRRYYRLTPFGSRVVDAELQRIRSVLNSAAARTVARRIRPA
jgi:DNA-binding PadR family transcriptional regulator